MTSEQFLFIIEITTYIQMNITNVSEEVADFIGCQFALESNFGMSDLAKKHSNFSGMKYALVRPRTSTPIKGSEFAHYKSLPFCLLDYLLALTYHRVGSWEFETIQRFSNAIKKWYCPEKDYINKINSIYQQFKSYINE